MTAKRLIPVLLLNEKKLEKTLRFSDPVYLGDPINAVRIFSDFAVDELLLINYSGISLDENYFAFLENLASEAFMPITYGGGVKKHHDVERIFDIGFDKILFNSALTESPETIAWTATRYGSQSTSLAINVLEVNSIYFLFSWKTKAIGELDWERLKTTCRDLGVGEIIITCVNREGTFKGYDTKLSKIASDIFNIPVVINGGLSCIDELAKLESLEVDFAASSVFCFVNSSRKSVLFNYPNRGQMEVAAG
jgi:cyclase